MVDAFALLISHAMLVFVIVRLLKVRDPSLPSREKLRPGRTPPRA